MAGVVLHEAICLNMEVAEHFVRPPTTDEPDDIRINSGQEEGSHSRRSKASGGNVRREKTKVGTEKAHTVSDCCGDDHRSDSGGGVEEPR